MSRILRRDPILLLFILGVAALLRAYDLDGSSLWHDEGNTWALVQRGYAEIARDAAADIHPPGYYWLLKLWTSVIGVSAPAIRSLSALAGLLVVAVIYAIGQTISAEQPDGISDPLSHFALLAAWIAALNPFQIYYSQEARMYALLALESAGLFWTLLLLQRRLRLSAESATSTSLINGPSVAYVLFGAAGLWTHYSFPVVLAAAGLSYLIVWILVSRKSRWRWTPLLHFAVLNLLILLAFVPWMQTAINSLLTWPKGGVSVALADGLALTLRTLLFGPLRHPPEPLWPWLVAAGLLPLVGIVALRRRRAAISIALWMFAPIVLMFGLGLFSDAFLKFLLVASPPWCLLVAAAPNVAGKTKRSIAITSELLLALGAVILAALTLPAYYADAGSRDNYEGVARYIEAVADPTADLVLLNAPGQQEVWSYYDPGVPVLALPTGRPVDPAITIAELTQATSAANQVFALFWATDESDPDAVVETWLDRNGFKGVESWQGNVRFVTYTMAKDLECRRLETSTPFEDPRSPLFVLEEICFSAKQSDVTAGDTLLVGLRWRSLEETPDAYKVSLQMLNQRDQVIAQLDGEPGGGSIPTSTWQAGQRVEDNHGLWVPFGTPPGEYRLALAVYDAATGARLRTEEGDAIVLETVRIVPAERVTATDVIPVQHRTNKQVGPLTLVGYNLHRKGYAHSPESPVAPGDTVELVLYWQAPDPLSMGWPQDLVVELTLGEQTIPFAPAGNDHPTGQWQPGEVVRSMVDFTYEGGDRQPVLSVNGESVRLDTLPR